MSSGAVTKKIDVTFKFFKEKLFFPLILFSLASYGVIESIPLMIHTGTNDQPTTLQFASIGVCLILVSSLFLTYTARLIGLTRGWLFMQYLQRPDLFYFGKKRIGI